MAVPFIIGIIVGLICVQWMPMPRWRIMGALIALGMITTGVDVIAVLALPVHSGSSSGSWKALAAGALVGAGFGYFVQWIRIILSRRTNDTPID